jgi:hypothetical protein
MDQTLALCADVKTPFSYPWFTANILTTPQTHTFFRTETNKRNNREKRRKKTTKAMRDKASDMKT